MLIATLQIYADCAYKAYLDALRNWPFILGSLGLYFAYILTINLLAPFGPAGGILVGFIHAVLLSMYYLWLSESISRNKLTFKDLLQFDYGLFSNVIGVAFIIWIMEYMLATLLKGQNQDWILACFELGILLIFNAIPEVVYIQRNDSLNALAETYRFIQRNWIEWFIPFVLLLAPIIYLSPIYILIDLASISPFVPAISLIIVPMFVFPSFQYLALMIGIILMNWFMIFRGHLFRELESGSRRQRAFKSKLS